MVMIRHAGSSTADLRTTLILLCEDGSLRIYMASVDHTNFWMVPAMQPGVNLATEGSGAKLERKKLTHTGNFFRLLSYSVEVIKKRLCPFLFCPNAASHSVFCSTQLRLCQHHTSFKSRSLFLWPPPSGVHDMTTLVVCQCSGRSRMCPFWILAAFNS